MNLAIDIVHSFPIARTRIQIDRGLRPLLEIVANIADRSGLGQIATNTAIQKSYDPVSLWPYKVLTCDSKSCVVAPPE